MRCPLAPAAEPQEWSSADDRLSFSTSKKEPPFAKIFFRSLWRRPRHETDKGSQGEAEED
jgi:hypothetical protein